MVLPVIRVEVDADTAQATDNIQDFKREVAGISSPAAKASRSSVGLSKAFNTTGVSAALASNKTRQITQQLSQVAQQSVATGQVMQAFAIQAADIGLSFGVVGTVVGALAGITIPLLATAFSSASGTAFDLEKATDGVTDAMSQANDIIDLLRLDVDELSKSYGEAAERVRDFAIFQAELAVAQSSARLSEQIGLLDDLTNRYANLGRRGGTIAGLIAIQKDFGDVTREQAREIQRSFREIDNATTFDQQQAALEGLITSLTEMEVNLSELPPELRRSIDEMITFSNETDRARALVAQLAAEAQGVTIGVPLFLQDFGDQGLLPPEPGVEPGRTGRGGGGARTDPNAARIESLVNSLQTERELVEQFRAEGLELLALAGEEELAAIGGLNEAKLRLEQEYQDRLAGIKQTGAAADLAVALGSGQQVLNALGSFNDKALKAARVFGAAQALIGAFQGAAEALKLPYPLNLAAAASVLSTGLGFVSSIKGVSSSGGGGGGGGGGAVPAPVTAAPAPLQATISGFSPDSLFTGSSVTTLFDMLQEEAGDRGVRTVFT